MSSPRGGVRRGEIDPFAVAAMEEIGIDLSRQNRSRMLEDLEDEAFDLIVTLSPEAHHRALGADPNDGRRGDLLADLRPGAGRG